MGKGVQNIKLKIIESQEDILNIIDKPIGSLANFDYQADYPLYTEKVFNTDSYSIMIQEHYPAWLDTNWVPILVSKGFLSQYVWIYPPHNCTKDDVKILKYKKGECLAYNIKFDKMINVPYSYITVDMSFIGCKVPIHWNPDNRKLLFIDILNCLTAKNVVLIMAKSKRYVNYNVDLFLENITKNISDLINTKIIKIEVI